MFGDIFRLDIPIGHPAVLAVFSRARENPRPPKHAPILDIELFLAPEKLAADKGKPNGVRLIDAGYLLMVLASPRFSDTKVIFEFWENETALRGHSRDLRRRGRPVIFRDTPRGALSGSHAWASVLLRSRTNHPPGVNGHRALFPVVDDDWKVHAEKTASYNLVLNLFRRTCVELGFSNPKWAPTFRTCVASHLCEPVGMVRR